jgi:hypothetical protein
VHRVHAHVLRECIANASTERAFTRVFALASRFASVFEKNFKKVFRLDFVARVRQLLTENIANSIRLRVAQFWEVRPHSTRNGRWEG